MRIKDKIINRINALDDFLNKKKGIIALFAIIATILAAYCGASWGTSGSFDLWKAQQINEKQNVAKALSIEITSMKNQIDFSADMYKQDLVPRRLTPVFYSQPIYTEKGLYYSFQKEIATFNPKLSQSLYIFYDDLNRAEYYRNIVNEKSRIIATHPEYSTRTLNSGQEIQDMETSTFVNRWASPNNPRWESDVRYAKIVIWEGYDPNLTVDENEAIAQGRLANLEMKHSIVNASQMIPGILDQLNDVDKL